MLQAEDGIRALTVTGVQTCALPISFLGQTSGRNQAIWARGLRNPFTFAFQPGSSRMFINDVGQNTYEEINDGIAASNYGWPATEGRSEERRVGKGDNVRGGRDASSRRRHTSFDCDWSSDVCSSDLVSRADVRPQSSDLGTGAAQPLYVRVSARQQPHVHQRCGPEHVRGNQRRYRSVELWLAGNGGEIGRASCRERR